MILPPLPDGVSDVTLLWLYTDRARTQDQRIVPVALVDGRWTVDLLNIPQGRWWGTVNAQKDGADYSYPLLDPIDLPEDDRLIVSPEALATSIRIPLPLADADRDILRQAILDAQSDVVGYLGRPLMPQTYTQRGIYDWGDDWDLSAHGIDEFVRVISVTPEPGLDTFTVVYLAGINARDGEEYEPIRRYVRAHAANSPEVTRVWRVLANPEKTIKSASTAGQSVSYETPTLGGGGAAGSGAPGALPKMNSLDHWRLAGREVYQGRTRFGTRYGV